MTMTRQQARQQERAEQKIREKVEAFRAVNPMAETTYQQGFKAGWDAATRFVIKDCYAAAALAMHDIGRFGTKRNRRLLKKIDDYVVNRLTTEDLIDEALQNAGVEINFAEPFERVGDVDG